MVDNFIKNLITVNKDAVGSIENLETDVQNFKVKSEKDKATFGNLCVMLRGFRMVADATEAMLINENVLRGENGEFYAKVNLDEEQEQSETPQKENQEDE